MAADGSVIGDAAGVVVVEFPTMEQLRSWYDSSDYSEALAVRQTALTRRMLFVDGVDDQQAPEIRCP